MQLIDLQDIQYIRWHDLSNWESTVLLGNPSDYYSFKASWNSRDGGWYLSIKTLDNIVLVAGKKLILRTNVFAYCKKDNLPSCVLLADTEDRNIAGITYENMVSGLVKLFHITS